VHVEAARIFLVRRVGRNLARRRLSARQPLPPRGPLPHSVPPCGRLGQCEPRPSRPNQSPRATALRRGGCGRSSQVEMRLLPPLCQSLMQARQAGCWGVWAGGGGTTEKISSWCARQELPSHASCRLLAPAGS